MAAVAKHSHDSELAKNYKILDFFVQKLFVMMSSGFYTT